MTPKEKQRALDNAALNGNPHMSDKWAFAFALSDGTSVVAKFRHGVLMLDFCPSIWRDNRWHSRAKKIADQHAHSFFARPVMVMSAVTSMGPVFRYRGRMQEITRVTPAAPAAQPAAPHLPST